MKKNFLGKTSLSVSKLCFGTLTIGPLQSNKTSEEGGKLLVHGFEKGICFLDTAELYGTYSHIANALKNWNREEIVIATKSYAYSKETAETSLQKALKEMNIDYIDIFLLHEQESLHTIRGHYEALEFFLRMKENGYIKAVGISTHTIAAVRASLKIKEIEVIHPIVNVSGLGIQDGKIQEMLEVLMGAHQLGKGIYAMKPLGGGNLLKDFQKCFDFVLNLDFLDSIAVGMQSKEEIDVNVAIFEGKTVEANLLKKVKTQKRKLIIAHWCAGCGNCIEACSHKALKIENRQAKVDYEKCVLCGYCSRYCPHFCIKII